MGSAPKDHIPIARAVLGEEEERAVCNVLRSGWLSHGPRAMEFERRLAEYLGCRFVRAVNSGSSALHLTLKSLGVGAEDSVVVPALTCVATALPVLAVGANVTFVDVDPATLNVSWPDVEDVLRPEVKAVVLVHSFGRMADADGFAIRCRERGLHLVEDACLALGARQDSRCAGTFGTAGCFSFYPGKVIATGEGGAVCTDDAAIAEAVETDRNYGATTSSWKRTRGCETHLQGFERLAYNFKLTDLQAAIGIVQLDRLPGFLDERKRISARYIEALADVPCVQLPPFNPGDESNICQSFVCLWAPQPLKNLLGDSAAMRDATSSLDRLRSRLRKRGIAVGGAGQFLPALPVFRSTGGNEQDLKERFPAAFCAEKLAFRLPIFPGMTSSQIDRVVETFRDEVRGIVGERKRETPCSPT